MKKDGACIPVEEGIRITYLLWTPEQFHTRKNSAHEYVLGCFYLIELVMEKDSL